MKKGILPILLVLLLFNACSNKPKESNIKTEITNTIDTVYKNPETDTVFFVIPDVKYRIFEFDSSSKALTLSLDDFKQISELLVHFFDKYNLKKKGYDVIDIKKYKCQIIPAITKKGDREVKLYCTRSKYYYFKKNKYKITDIMDGGNGHLQIKINLTTKKCYDLFVNGSAK